jgi:hypothetical protein
VATTNQGQNASVATPLALTLVTTVDIPAGDTVFCTVVDVNTTAPTFVITDTVDANPWTLDYDNANVSGRQCLVFRKVLASPMLAGSVITSTPTGGTVITFQGIWVDSKTGAWTPRAQAGPLTTSGTAYASPTLASLNGDFAYAICLAFGTETTISVAAPFAVIGLIFNHTLSGRWAIDDVLADGPIQALFTVATSHTGAVVILAYIPSGPPPTPPSNPYIDAVTMGAGIGVLLH